jgi:hypothetical protein
MMIFQKRIAACIIAVVLLMPAAVHSQSKKKTKSKKKEDEYAYKVLSNDPQHARNLSIYVTPVYVDLFSPNINFGYGVGLDYNFQNLVHVYGSYRASYLETTEPTSILDGAMGEAANGYTKFTNPEFGAEIYISGQESEVQEDISIKTEQDEQYHKTVYYVKQKANKYKMVGIRVGYQTINTIVNAGQVDFKGYDKNNPGAGTVDIGTGNYSTMMNEGIISIGASITNIHELTLDFKNYGEKSESSSDAIYADIMFAPSITYGDVNIVSGVGSSTGTVVTTYVLDAKATRQSLGFRLGVKEMDLKTFGGGIRAEIGLRPGTDFNNGWYIMGTLDLGLNLKVGNN